MRVVRLAALLHDVDDYKIVGRERAGSLQNTTDILDKHSIPEAVAKAVKEIIATMGYSKSLSGIRPRTIEGQIVSDANTWPDEEIAAETYNTKGTTHDTDSFINHFFEKLLLLRGMMLTDPGRTEGASRHKVMI